MIKNILLYTGVGYPHVRLYNKGVAMTEIIVYTTSACPKCKKLKSYLESIAVGYEVADMSTPASLTELRANGVFTTMAPVLQVEDSFLTLEEMFDGDRIRKDIIDELLGRASS